MIHFADVVFCKILTQISIDFWNHQSSNWFINFVVLPPILNDLDKKHLKEYPFWHTLKLFSLLQRLSISLFQVLFLMSSQLCSWLKISSNVVFVSCVHCHTFTAKLLNLNLPGFQRWDHTPCTLQYAIITLGSMCVMGGKDISYWYQWPTCRYCHQGCASRFFHMSLHEDLCKM